MANKAFVATEKKVRRLQLNRSTVSFEEVPLDRKARLWGLYLSKTKQITVDQNTTSGV